MINKKPSIIVICGPTGIGKTSAGIETAQAFGGEIISADSMQVYKYLDIGTAKPTKQETMRVFHHMIDIIDPDEDFSAAKFASMGNEIINRLEKENKVPFIVGGTGLYIKALVHGLFDVKPASDSDFKIHLKKQAKEYGTKFLYDQLKKLDSKAADKIHQNDTFRIIRALEVFESTGVSISEHQKKHGFSENRFNVLKVGLNMEREALYRQIEKRVDFMIEAGFEDEVKRLLDMNYAADLKSMQSIGYRHMTDYITGRTTLDEAIRTLKQDTRRFAKRQLTWFNADQNIIWVRPDQVEDIKILVGKFLNTGSDLQ
ncbi:tRNA (adenosine(37)-N6)-dimethylallyltransferase MiaA [Desulfobacterium sp. N47]